MMINFQITPSLNSLSCARGVFFSPSAGFVLILVCRSRGAFRKISDTLSSLKRFWPSKELVMRLYRWQNTAIYYIYHSRNRTVTRRSSVYPTFACASLFAWNSLQRTLKGCSTLAKIWWQLYVYRTVFFLVFFHHIVLLPFSFLQPSRRSCEACVYPRVEHACFLAGHDYYRLRQTSRSSRWWAFFGWILLRRGKQQSSNKL